MDIQIVTAWLLAQPGYGRAIMAWVVGMISGVAAVSKSRWQGSGSRDQATPARRRINNHKLDEVSQINH